VPQHACWVIEHAHEHGDIRAVVFDDGSGVTFLYREELAQLGETGETPVALLRDEAVMGV
jgi:hypothetical protein